MNARSTDPDKQISPEKRGRRLIGKALQRIRKRAGHGTDFAPGILSGTMVRMVESGELQVPLKKIRSYANALSSSLNGPKVDSDALTSAYVSLSEYISHHPKSRDEHQLFDWDTLSTCEAESEAIEYIHAELTRPVTYARLNSVPGASSPLDSLNPIQRVLLEEIAQRFRKFGTDVIGEAGLAEWERITAPKLRSVLAITCSLQSELDGHFVETFCTAAKSKQFLGYRYLVVHEGPVSDIAVAQNEIKALVKSALAKDDAFAKKLEVHAISKVEYRGFLDRIAPALADYWDGLYLYKLDSSSPDLLIGAFRRVAAPFGNAGKISLRSWGGIPINEAAPWRLVHPFEQEFELLWQKTTRIAGRSVAAAAPSYKARRL